MGVSREQYGKGVGFEVKNRCHEWEKIWIRIKHGITDEWSRRLLAPFGHCEGAAQPYRDSVPELRIYLRISVKSSFHVTGAGIISLFFICLNASSTPG